MLRTLILCCVVTVTTAAVFPPMLEILKKRIADPQYLLQQKAVLQLLAHVHQPLIVPELKDALSGLDFETLIPTFSNSESVKKFMSMLKSKQLLGKREVFSPLIESHAEEAKAVFEILKGATGWVNFLGTAVYIKIHVNVGVFTFAFSSAVIHRPDMEGIVLPPIYEICPHYFVPAETIQRAYEARMQSSAIKGSVTLPSNYTGWHTGYNPELRLSYFTEDVGLNAYHYAFHLTYPPWLEDKDITVKNDRRGELFWYTHQQILARYKLERLSNNMYKMEDFTYHTPHLVPYFPHLRYMNGKAAPDRPSNLELTGFDNADLERVKDFERRIRLALDNEYILSSSGSKVPITGENGIEVMSRLIEEAAGTVNPKYYGSLYRMLFNFVGHIADPYHADNAAPSVLQNYETMLRDPMYYRIYTRIARILEKVKKYLKPYKKLDLLFPNVTILTVSVTSMETYFENFDFDITNAVSVSKITDDKTMKIKARQPRLNHNNFVYTITATTPQKVVNGMVRIYMAPKYDYHGRALSLNEKRHFMLPLDRFPYQFTRGSNLITRTAKESTYTVPDMVTIGDLNDQVEKALMGMGKFMPYDDDHQYGFPNRLLLPKGKVNGMPYSLYVLITPYKPGLQNPLPVRGVKTFLTCGGLETCSDKKPWGWPFDREMDDDLFQLLPNFKEIDTTVTHKPFSDGTGGDI